MIKCSLLAGANKCVLDGCHKYKKVYCLCLINSLLSSTSCCNDSHNKIKKCAQSQNRKQRQSCVRVAQSGPVRSVSSRHCGEFTPQMEAEKWFWCLNCVLRSERNHNFLPRSVSCQKPHSDGSSREHRDNPLKVPALIHHVSECWITLFFADSFHAKIFWSLLSLMK